MHIDLVLVCNIYSKGSTALELLVKVSVYASELTGIFYRRVGDSSKQDMPSTSYPR